MNVPTVKNCRICLGGENKEEVQEHKYLRTVSDKNKRGAGKCWKYTRINVKNYEMRMYSWRLR